MFQSQCAVMRAEGLARKEGLVGAVAFSPTGDPATGDFSDAKLIRKFGEVPDDLSALAGTNRAYVDGNYFSQTGGITCASDNSTTANTRWGINDSIGCTTRITEGSSSFMFVTTRTADNN